MTQIKVDTLTDAAGTGAPDFVDGVTYEGGALSSLNTFEYYSTGTEPSTPNDGAIWWDTGNDKVFMFINDEWKEVELGASASTTVDLSNVTYDNVSFSVASQDSSVRGLDFNTDGTKMYVAGGYYDKIYQYSLSTGFDISTASYDSVSIAHNDGNPRIIVISPDGTKILTLGSEYDNIYQYSLSTAFDLSTATYDSVFSVANQASQPSGLDFNTDGTKMYIVDYLGDFIYQYSLSTGFDVSTASYDSVSIDVSSEDLLPAAIQLSSDGTKLYMVGSYTDSVHQYSLSTAFDLNTASYDSVSFDHSSQALNSYGLRFNADYTKLYLTEGSTIYQYSTGL